MMVTSQVGRGPPLPTRRLVNAGGDCHPHLLCESCGTIYDTTSASAPQAPFQVFRTSKSLVFDGRVPDSPIGPLMGTARFLSVGVPRSDVIPFRGRGNHEEQVRPG